MKTKKELKDAYKQMKFKIGIFQIRNTLNNKVFVESSNDLDAIWNRHRFQLNCGNHPNIELQKDWKEHGEENFKYEILSELKHHETDVIDYSKELKTLEEMFLQELNPFDEAGYNRRSKKR